MSTQLLTEVVFGNVLHEEQSCSHHCSGSELVASGSTPAS